MEKSKLMTPLFYDGSFNREGHKMRAVFERKISDGTNTYRLWRSTGKPDWDYPSAENDKYNLYVEINGYLVSLGMSDFRLADCCGSLAAVQKLYGGDEERERYFDHLRKSEGDIGVRAALDAERKEIERCGNDPIYQTDYIQKQLILRVNAYLEAKENGGKTSPDFVGALIVDDLAHCAELSKIYKAKQQEKRMVRLAQIAEKERIYCEERNREFHQTVSDAIQIIRTGGVLRNETVEYYRSRYDSSAYSIFNYLMRLYQVDVPLRTQGWINERLSSVMIKDGRYTGLQYFQPKGSHGSQKFSDCMNALIQAVMEQTPEQEVEDKSA